MRKKILGAVAMLLAICMLVTAFPAEPVRAAQAELNIYAMYLESDDKGESVLLESKGSYLLMDLGAYGNVDAIIKQLKERGASHIGLYLSHLHMDHYGGSNHITGNKVLCGIEKLRNAGITIDRLYLPDPSLAPESADYADKYRKFEKFMGGSNITYLKKGDSFQMGDANVEIIGPCNTDKIHPDDYKNEKADDDGGEGSAKYTYYENNCCLVAKVTCGSVSYLSMGDALEDEVNEMIRTNKSAMKADILKLSHHGTGSGNSDKLIQAVQPSYTFAQNTGLTGKSKVTKKWLTNMSRKNSIETAMCYLVGNQKKTLIYHISNGDIRLYEDSMDDSHMLKGWVRLDGGDGEFRSIDRYYFGDNGKPLTGVQKLDGHYYYFGKGGCMEYGNFNEHAVYQGWKSYDTGKRYYTFSKDKEYAYMAVGFTKIGKQTFYFDKNGYKVDGKTRTILKKIGKYKYGIGKSGAVVINNWATIGNAKYYFDKQGHMVTNKYVKIAGKKYYFGKDGKMKR